jgi:hypothetical protein
VIFLGKEKCDGCKKCPIHDCCSWLGQVFLGRGMLRLLQSYTKPKASFPFSPTPFKFCLLNHIEEGTKVTPELDRPHVSAGFTRLYL